MRKFFLLPVSVLFFLNAGAQQDSLKWVKEINEQVWKPFITHFISGNKEGFRSVHSKRITRVEIDRDIVQDYEKYFPRLHGRVCICVCICVCIYAYVYTVHIRPCKKTRPRKPSSAV